MITPEVQTKAQAELDRVIGRDRLPTLDDRKDLPYIESIAWEAFRWNPGTSSVSLNEVILSNHYTVTPLGLARQVTEDDEYRGFFIPKGTTVFPNVW